MLINIFGHWINPHYIKRVENSMDGRCLIDLADTLNSVSIKGKTADEVAGEVNKHFNDKGKSYRHAHEPIRGGWI